MGELYQEEISRAPVPLVKHFKFVLGTKPNHSQGIGSVSMTKRSVERQLVQSQMEDAQKRANDLELEVQNLTKVIQKQEETNLQLQSELQSQRQLIENHQLAMKTQHDQMKQDIESEMRHQMTTLLGSLSFSTSNVVSSNKVSSIIIYFLLIFLYLYIFKILLILLFIFVIYFVYFSESNSLKIIWTMFIALKSKSSSKVNLYLKVWYILVLVFL